MFPNFTVPVVPRFVPLIVISSSAERSVLFNEVIEGGGAATVIVNSRRNLSLFDKTEANQNEYAPTVALEAILNLY